MPASGRSPATAKRRLTPIGRKVNIYIPLDLYDEARGQNLNLSRILRDALEGVLKSPAQREHYGRRNYVPGPGGGKIT